MNFNNSTQPTTGGLRLFSSGPHRNLVCARHTRRGVHARDPSPDRSSASIVMSRILFVRVARAVTVFAVSVGFGIGLVFLALGALGGGRVPVDPIELVGPVAASS